MIMREFMKYQRLFKEYEILKGMKNFDYFNIDNSNQLENETNIHIKDDGVNAWISLNNKGLEEFIFLARIDSEIKGEGKGSSFLNQLKSFCRANKLKGIVTHPESERNFNFYSKNGFKEKEKDLWYWYS